MATTRVAPQNWREYRRLRAWEMHPQGYTQQAIADALGLTQPAVSYSIKRAKAGGIAALHHHKSPGAPARLSGEQKPSCVAIHRDPVVIDFWSTEPQPARLAVYAEVAAGWLQGRARGLVSR